ncbi:type II secretion system major pseudopilin GspG [Arsukibacterium indicum]|uniref:Type II secretion system major pseudopilin GspG n=1 Tax=Arsukibacterium indicum TaxID=2848612 RepID=A0ABS6MG79_9GAMM|nr:type II secretion system major pseudopilin GspG [Arsukibacterium indicum]MBV2127793.1 type II secretion system major pseudopilin GspG [Arsukibacterium indicum]
MKLKKVRGFTLIELLIVIVIVGLLASLVAPEMFSKVDSSRIKTAKAQMELLETSLNTYRLDIGRYPTTLDELVKSDHKNWDGPYLPKEVPLDPWGNPYVYTSATEGSTSFNLMSYGRDGRAGGEGDDADIVHK